MSTKICKRCTKELQLDSFRQKKNGEYLVTCKDCNLKISTNKRKQVHLRSQVPENMDVSTHQKCSTCFVVKLLSEFNKVNNRYTKSCTECRTKLSKSVVEYISDTQKVCTRCKETKNIDDFDNTKAGITKRCTQCNEIGKEYQRKKKHEKITKLPPINEEVEAWCIKCLTIKPLDQYKVAQNGKCNKTCNECCDKHMTYLKSKCCEHGCINKSSCKLCNGTSWCEHNRIRTYCQECKGGSTCEHHYRKDRCAICNGSQYCEHDILRTFCRSCNGGSFCDHGTRRTRCRICIGGSICEHGKVRFGCKICDPIGFFRSTVSGHVRKALKQNKDKCSINYLCCDITTFRKHLEEQFEDGMTWDNYGDWHIDHIVPIKYQNPTLKNIIERLHYTNTQPMWAKENMSKGNRFIGRTNVKLQQVAADMVGQDTISDKQCNLSHDITI